MTESQPIYYPIKATRFPKKITKKQINNSNNSLVFSWDSYAREGDYYDNDNQQSYWYEVSIPPGEYTIDEINDKFEEEIKKITKKNNSDIIICPTYDDEYSIITIKSPIHTVDIYNSSIRTVLGWPKKQPVEVYNPPRILRWGNFIRRILGWPEEQPKKVHKPRPLLKWCGCANSFQNIHENIIRNHFSN